MTQLQKDATQNLYVLHVIIIVQMEQLVKVATKHNLSIIV